MSQRAPAKRLWLLTLFPKPQRIPIQTFPLSYQFVCENQRRPSNQMASKRCIRNTVAMNLDLVINGDHTLHTFFEQIQMLMMISFPQMCFDWAVFFLLFICTESFNRFIRIIVCTFLPWKIRVCPILWHMTKDDGGKKGEKDKRNSWNFSSWSAVYAFVFTHIHMQT